MIHHESVKPHYGQDEDAYDVIESNGAIAIWHHSMELGTFDTVTAAALEAEILAQRFDYLWLQDSLSGQGRLPS